MADEKLARLVDLDPAEVWRRLDAEPGDVSDLVDVANRVATVDGAVNALERGTHLRASRSVRARPTSSYATHEAAGREANGRPQITELS